MEISDELAEQVLAAPLADGNDAGVANVREYLFRLLHDVWEYDEGFDGKRPFGNSGWKWDLRAALGRAGLVEITFDEDGYVHEMSDEAEAKADQLVHAAISYMCDVELVDTEDDDLEDDDEGDEVA